MSSITSGSSRGLRRTLGALALAASVLVRPCTAADVVISSESKAADVIALGFTEFKCTKGDPASLQFSPGTVTAWDLDFSGRFKINNRPQFDETSKAMFKEDGALAYVRGEYALDGDKFTLQCELIDLESGEKIVAKKY